MSRHAGYSPASQLRDLARAVPERESRIKARIAKSSTRSVCPGCVVQPASPYHRNYRPADEVCDDCLETLWRAEDALQAEQRRREAGGDELLLLGDEWPYLFPPSNTARRGEELEALSRTCHALVVALTADRIEICRGSAFNFTFRGVRSWARGDTPSTWNPGALAMKVPAGSKAALEALPGVVDAALKATFEAGVEHGCNLIGRLAAGEITVDQFDARGRGGAR